MNPPSNKRRSERKAKRSRTKKKRAPKTHAVTFMTPALEVVSRPQVKVPQPKPVHEQPTYGSRQPLSAPSIVLETDPGIIKQPMSNSMHNVHDILSFIDWKVKLYWFHAGTPAFVQEYWNNRGPLIFPKEKTPHHPRQRSIRRFHDKLCARVQSLFRGAQLRMTIQARLDLETLHMRYRKVQFVHPKPRCLCFVNLNPCKGWKERHAKKKQDEVPTTWKCPRCAFENKVEDKRCICGKKRPGVRVDTSAGFTGDQCPFCAALVLQIWYRKRKIELHMEGILRFTWRDPHLHAYQEPETPIMRKWISERLALRARITELNATLWEEKLQRFRRDKANHSYAVEEHYREIHLRRQAEAARLIEIWKEQQLLSSFVELKRQRDAQGRGEGSAAALAAAAGKTSKKGRARRRGQSIVKRKGTNNGDKEFSKRDRDAERAELIGKLRKEAMLQEESSQASIEKRALFEEKKIETMKQQRQSQVGEHMGTGEGGGDVGKEDGAEVGAEVEVEADKKTNREETEKIEVECAESTTGKKEGTKEEGTKEEGTQEEDTQEKGTQEEGTQEGGTNAESTKTPKVKDIKADDTNAATTTANDTTAADTHDSTLSIEKQVEQVVQQMVEQLIQDNTELLEEKTDAPPRQPKKKIKKKTRKLGTPEEEAAREIRIRKNEDAKIHSYVRRLNLTTYLDTGSLREGAVTIAQSLYRGVAARIFAAKKRRQRATRLTRVKAQYWQLRDAQWERGWSFLLGEYHRFRREAALKMQGAFRASVARGIVKRARRWSAIHVLQAWWRGTWARNVVVVEKKKQRRIERLTRRVMARIKHGGLLYTLHAWHANVIEIRLNRDRLFLLRQIADEKWVRCCAIRIQTCWRRFYYTQIDGAHHIHSIEFGQAATRVQKLRQALHPRLVQLVHQLETTGNADEFAIRLLGDVEMWQNPEENILLASQIELGNRIPLEPLPLHQMQAWIEHTMKRTLLWRPQPLDCIVYTGQQLQPEAPPQYACRCNPAARNAIHRAGYCRGKIGLPHVVWFPFLHVVQNYFQAVETMREVQRRVVQALQEKRMVETFGRLILADTSDRGNRFGQTHTRWSKMSLVTRSRMNNRALNKDEEQHDYVRWFVRDIDTCAKCNGLLSWQATTGKCKVCGTKRFEAPTASSTLQSKLLLPPLGSRRGTESRQGLYGVGDIQENIQEFIYHAAFCCYAPPGHWRRLMPKWKVWEESRIQLAEPTLNILMLYNISTIGSLWLAKIAGQLDSIPELNVEVVDKLCRLMEFLADFIMGELLAPEGEGVEEEEEAAVLLYDKGEQMAEMEEMYQMEEVSKGGKGGYMLYQQQQPQYFS